MKTYSDIYAEFNEGLFSKKSPEEKKAEQMRDDIRKLSSKAAGKSGFSKGDQEAYNKLWIEYRKLNDGKPPKGPKPSVFMEPGMSVYKHADLVKALHKKLGIKD